MFQFCQYILDTDPATNKTIRVFAFHKARTLFMDEFWLRQATRKYRPANDNQESPVAKH